MDFGIAALVFSLGFLMYLCMKGVPIFVAAFLSGLIVLVTAGLDPVQAMMGSYASGLGKYFGDFFFIFVLGSIFGKLTDISGAADSIAKAIIEKFGDKYIVPAIVMACAILTYGGVSVFVALFTVYPMMLSLFKKANLPRYLIPAVYFAGAGTFSCMLPGSPQIQNLIPMKFLGTTADAALSQGLIAGAFEAVLVFTYLAWLLNRVRKSGEGATEHADDAKFAERANAAQPHWLLALAPMLVLLISLNLFKLPAPLALFVGILSAFVCYVKYIDWKSIWKNLGAGTSEGTSALFNTSAVVGFGYLVQLTPAFKAAITLVTSLGGNPLISAAVAVTALAGICGSGSGALGIAMPILAEYYLPLGVSAEALHRVATLACLGLDSLPHNGLVVTVLVLTGLTHKQAYLPVGVLTVAIPLITLVFMVGLFIVMPI